jgi:dihydroflavonol-4-reductase
MADRVLVTGANGHIGSSVVRQLPEDGYRPVAFVRKGANLRGLDGLDLERVEGDILDAASVREAVRGCRYVLHLAAVNRTRVTNPNEVMKPAVEGSENVLRAAADAGVGRVVATSSVAAIGVSATPDELRDESHWNDERNPPYAWAKTVAERRSRELAEELDVDLLTINPGFALGPYDYRLTPTSRYPADLLDGTGQTGIGGFGYVDVRDVALAHVRALTRGTPGERYIVSGANATLEQLGETLSEMTGIGVTHLPVPRWAALPIVAVLAGFSRLAGRTPAATVAEARSVVDRYAFYDGSKAADAFDLRYADLREMLDQTIRWLVFIGALRPRTMRRLGGRFPPDERWLP